jgi:hypothetical protein
VNDDGEVNISDVTALIDYLLFEDATGINLDAADCDKNNEVSISLRDEPSGVSGSQSYSSCIRGSSLYPTINLADAGVGTCRI